MLTMMLDLLGGVLIGSGVLFFLSGTLALVRFPDLYCRLHALTKADNLGLGLVASGVALQSGSWWLAFKLLFIWLLVMLASASVAYLIAGMAHRTGGR